ncbi:MAG: hypothetical protein L3J31_00985 [Bacteroidales bacterium]|nr:hypothetical protein [Bacteroidales bacterium]
MKPILQIITLCLLFTQTTMANTLTVKQDSTGDYNIIQDAIDAATNSDTILVWPGTYFENIEIIGKNITLGSLHLTTGDESYIFNTIIDANQNGSCVVFKSGVNNAVLQGFTLQHGSGYFVYPFYQLGGGVLILESSANVVHCIIKDNSAHEGGGGISIWKGDTEIVNCTIKNNFTNNSGGGISCAQYSTIKLEGTNIFNNQAYLAGGGLTIGYRSSGEFDENNLCNIYLNFSSWGSDIIQGDYKLLHVIVDTFTVLNPDAYFLLAVDGNGFPSDSISYSMLNQKITPVDADLFVNPVTGDNNNTGLSADSHLKSIAFAYSKIAVDSLEKNTIHLANGLYSDSTNNEKFPLNIRPFINITGQSREGTVLDGRYESMLIKGNHFVSNYTFKNMTMKKGNFVDYLDFANNREIFGKLYWENENISFDSIIFTDGTCDAGKAGLRVTKSNNTRITNCTFQNIKGDAALRIALWNSADTCRVYNSFFLNNKPDYNNQEHLIGRGLNLSGGYGEGVGIVTNSLFENNDKEALWAQSLDIYLTNCTFVNNSLEVPGETVGILIGGSTLKMLNCIFFNNGEYPVWVASWEDIEGNLFVNNSLLEGGEESITVKGNSHLYYDDQTNIDTDPFFLNKWEHPYQIDNGSPCIDAGTLANLPDFIELPEYDLAGNPRIVGDSIDMGAYEWNPTVGVDEYLPVFKKEKPKLLRAAPNPFSWNTTISANWDFEGHVQIEIYNNAGLRVKVLKSGAFGPGSIQARWQGDDQTGNILPAGIYHVVMFWDGREIEGMKVVKK